VSRGAENVDLVVRNNSNTKDKFKRLYTHLYFTINGSTKLKKYKNTHSDIHTHTHTHKR